MQSTSLLNILVPTDFSEKSNMALNMALQLAAHHAANIHLLHVIPLPSHIALDAENNPIEDGEVNAKMYLQQKENALQQLQLWVDKTKAAAQICVCFGNINEQIIHYANKKTMHMVVMGTHTVHGVKEMLLSTHAEYIGMHLDIPLLTIKSNDSVHEIKNILLAGSFKSEEIVHCKLLLQIQQAYNAQLHLLRINTPSDFLPDHIAKSHMESFAKKHELHQVTIGVYNDHDIEEGILHYAAQNNIDLIAIGSKQRTGVNKILNGCVSADLINHTLKPLLSFKIHS